MKIRRSCSVFSQQGLTLVEILLVIAVIAILCVLAVPAYRKVINSADRSVTAGRLKQAYAAFRHYASDHQGEIPGGGTTHAVRWASRLLSRGYLEAPDNSAMFCVTLGCDAQRRQFNYFRRQTFSKNGRIGIQPDGSPLLGAGRINLMPYPSQTALLMHGVWGASWGGFNEETWEDRYYKEVEPVFDGKVYVLFCDGNVDLIPVDDIPKDRTSLAGRKFWLGTD